MLSSLKRHFESISHWGLAVYLLLLLTAPFAIDEQVEPEKGARCLCGQTDVCRRNPFLAIC